MRVSEDDRGKPSRLGIEIECGELMQNIQPDVTNANDLAEWQRLCPVTSVHVSTNSNSGCNSSERFEHVGATDITRVNDQRGALQRRDDLGTDHSVSVRNHTHNGLRLSHSVGRTSPSSTTASASSSRSQSGSMKPDTCMIVLAGRMSRKNSP